MQDLLEERWWILRVKTNIKLRFFPESKGSNQYGQHGSQSPYAILGSRIRIHKMKRVQRPHHPSSTVGSIVVLLTGEEVQGDWEHSTDLSWVRTGTKRLLYEANHWGHQQTTLSKEMETGGGNIRKRWIQRSRCPERWGFYCPTLLMTGKSLQTTWTSSGGRPISSSASLRAVSASSLSLGSLFPPGKHTSPPLVRSYTHTSIKSWVRHINPSLNWHSFGLPLLSAGSSRCTALRSSQTVGSVRTLWAAPVEMRACFQRQTALKWLSSFF